MANKRIIDLAEVTTVASDTYVMVDSEVDGTRRYDLSQTVGDVEAIDERVSTLELGTTIADGAVTLPKLASDIFAVVSTQAIAEMFED